MTEHQQPQQGGDQVDQVDEVDDAPEPPKAEPYKAPAPKSAKDTGRFSAYDTTLGRFTGGVHDSKGKARDAAKDQGVTDVEIVEV